jgi:hypothetical protein
MATQAHDRWWGVAGLRGRELAAGAAVIGSLILAAIVVLLISLQAGANIMTQRSIVLTELDDHGTRHALGASAITLTELDDHGTRHAIGVPKGWVLTHQDDFGTRHRGD